MSIHYEDQLVTLHHGDCLDVLRGIPDASIDSVVCDPPYGLSNTDPAHVADTIVHWVNGERDYLPPVAGLLATPERDAEHRRAGAVEALRGAADYLSLVPSFVDVVTWLRERADRIEAKR